jgi:hypothetical protein
MTIGGCNQVDLAEQQLSGARTSGEPENRICCRGYWTQSYWNALKDDRATSLTTIQAKSVKLAPFRSSVFTMRHDSSVKPEVCWERFTGSRRHQIRSFRTKYTNLPEEARVLDPAKIKS